MNEFDPGVLMQPQSRVNRVRRYRTTDLLYCIFDGGHNPGTHDPLTHCLGPSTKMDTDQLAYWGRHMLDFICEYFDGLNEYNVLPTVEPGYLRPLLPGDAPEEPEDWKDILNDVKKYILPGLTHWQHPRFHAYFPCATSTPSVLGDMLSSALGCNGFSWAASPAITELEIIVTDWMARLLKLPEEFTHSSGIGGGVIQTTSSDSVLVSMLAARYRAIEHHKKDYAASSNRSAAVLTKLVAYTSALAHSCVEKASMICFVKFRPVETDEDYGVQGHSLRSAIEEDLRNGLIPFYFCATLGTTSCGSFDHLESIALVCREFNVWLHVDAAYVGSAFICPEFRPYLNGIEHADSLSVNPYKWMLVGFDCSLMWVRDRQMLTQTMSVDPLYLQHKHSRKTVDFRHWGIPLSRRFRALKLWFVLRAYGVNELREYIRNHVRLAKLFADKVVSDERFELFGKPLTGLVCFRLKGSNTLTEYLTRAINESLRIHVIPAMVDDVYFIRFVVCNRYAKPSDIDIAWNCVTAIAKEVLTARDAMTKWLDTLTAKIDRYNESYESSFQDNLSEDEPGDWMDLSESSASLTISNLDGTLTKLAKRYLAKLKCAKRWIEYNHLTQNLQAMGWDLSKLDGNDEAEDDELACDTTDIEKMADVLMEIARTSSSRTTPNTTFSSDEPKCLSYSSPLVNDGPSTSSPPSVKSISIPSPIHNRNLSENMAAAPTSTSTGWNREVNLNCYNVVVHQADVRKRSNDLEEDIDPKMLCRFRRHSLLRMLMDQPWMIKTSHDKDASPIPEFNRTSCHKFIRMLSLDDDQGQIEPIETIYATSLPIVANFMARSPDVEESSHQESPTRQESNIND